MEDIEKLEGISKESRRRISGKEKNRSRSVQRQGEQHHVFLPFIPDMSGLPVDPANTGLRAYVPNPIEGTVYMISDNPDANAQEIDASDDAILPMTEESVNKLNPVEEQEEGEVGELVLRNKAIR